MNSPNAVAGNRSTYSACRYFFEELIWQGVQHAVISPGSRSTALALTADATSGLRCWVRIDERSAAFFALGIAKATARPVILICTSGTAAANYLPAVVEAHYSEVPLIVLTADRPPELRDWGAGQTIDQRHLYGSHTRWFVEAPLASELSKYDLDAGAEIEPEKAERWWTSLAARTASTAMGAGNGSPGPVHINWPFREPLEPPPGWFDEQAGSSAATAPLRSNRTAEPARLVSDTAVEELVDFVNDHVHGVVVAGPMHRATGATEQLQAAVTRFCIATGWPLFAEPTSQLRQSTSPSLVIGSGATSLAEPINHFDLLLATDWANEQPPTAVLRLGNAPVSKPLRIWLERHQPDHILVNPSGNWTDASFTAASVIAADPTTLLTTATHRVAQGSHCAESQPLRLAWASRWLDADTVTKDFIEAALTDQLSESNRLTEAAIVVALSHSLPAGHTLVASNSLPVRSVNTYLAARTLPLTVHANRGASGIDGVISTAAGNAAAGFPTTVMLGDLAFRHDLGGLAALRETVLPVLPSRPRPASLTVLVVDNGGGMIFAGLPVSQAANPEQFERLFATPTSPDSQTIAATMAQAFGFEHHHIPSSAHLARLNELLANPTEGVRIITVSVDAAAGAKQQRSILDNLENALKK